MALGWGTTYYDGHEVDILRGVPILVWTNEDCDQVNNDMTGLSPPTMFVTLNWFEDCLFDLDSVRYALMCVYH